MDSGGPPDAALKGVFSGGPRRPGSTLETQLNLALAIRTRLGYEQKINLGAVFAPALPVLFHSSSRSSADAEKCAMYPFLSFAHPKRAASGWCIFAGFIGGLMHIVSLSMVVLWLGWVVVTGVLDVTQSSWFHRGVQRATAALEEKLGKVCGSFASEIEALSPAFTKDDVKIQMDETRARRKLAKELRRPKSPTGGIKVVWHQGRKS